MGKDKGIIILLCGKVCSGKSTYAHKIKEQHNAVILSCDELMLRLFPEQLGDAHRQITEKTQAYLYDLAEQIAFAGTNVILDFGFWFADDRRVVRECFMQKGIRTELHYLPVMQETWLANIQKRNEQVQRCPGQAYTIDENMKQLFDARFEEPDESEVDVLYTTPLE
jgi:predicted kinase